MHLSLFLTDSRMQGGGEIPPELGPLLLIITRLGMNSYSDDAQAMTRICLAVIVMEGELPESDLLMLGRDAQGWSTSSRLVARLVHTINWHGTRWRSGCGNIKRMCGRRPSRRRSDSAVLQGSR